jgi:leucyl aminopeptidase
MFPHAAFPQKSVIVKVPGRSNRTVIVGGHLDSVNSANRLQGRAPGVDDNGSGSFVILDALRVLLSDKDFGPSKLQNTIEFHWYAAEEGGLLGSQGIFTNYKNSGKVVKAMLQQDMTGYVKPGSSDAVGVITDYVDAGLTSFIKKVVTAVSLRPV